MNGQQIWEKFLKDKHIYKISGCFLMRFVIKSC
nr:MAG TPA: hypothetical protein [Caudoviricetes sp.]